MLVFPSFFFFWGGGGDLITGMSLQCANNISHFPAKKRLVFVM